MILPAKHLKQDRALLGIGHEVLTQLDEQRTISETWERFQLARGAQANPISFDWFVLALGFLFAIGAITVDGGVLRKCGPQ